MNILQISTSDMVGGAARVGWTLNKELKREGHTTSMFVKEKKSQSNNVFEIPKRFWERKLANLLATDVDFFNSDYILKTKEYEKADIIQCHNLHGYYFSLQTLIKMSYEKPVVWTLHDMWAVTPHCAHAFDRPLKNGFYECPNLETYEAISWHNEIYLKWRKQSIYKKTALNIVTPSLWLKNKITGTVLGNKKITLIANGIDQEFFQKKEKIKVRRKLSLPVNKQIVFISSPGGDRNPWKGWLFANQVIRNFEKSPEILFVAIGNTQLDGFSKSNLKVIDYVVDPDQMVDYYNASDIFLLTSVAENFPLTVLEAMAVGLPVVAFDVGGVSEQIVHKRTGYLANYKNVSDLISGINYVLHLSFPEREKMSVFARQKCKKEFSSTLMAKRYINLYKQLL